MQPAISGYFLFYLLSNARVFCQTLIARPHCLPLARAATSGLDSER